MDQNTALTIIFLGAMICLVLMLYIHRKYD